MADLGISNIVSNQVIPAPCGQNCNNCSAIMIYQCAARISRDTGETHCVVELCESCGVSQATTVKYNETTTFKVCASCHRLIGLIKQIH